MNNKKDVNYQNIIDILKKIRSFMMTLLRYKYCESEFKCKFEELIDIFEIDILIDNIEETLKSLGILFKSDT